MKNEKTTNQNRCGGETSNSSETDKLAMDDLNIIQDIYLKHATEIPDFAVDRQILASAAREIKAPSPRKKLTTSWWQRVSLPLYVAATFTFTVIAGHYYWPAPVKMPPGTSASSKPVTIDVQLMPEVENQARINLNKNKLNMPELKPIQALPKLPKTATSKQQSRLFEQAQADVKLLPVINAQIDLKPTVSQSQSFDSPVKTSESNSNQAINERDIWVKKIIELVKVGDSNKLQQELVEFKQRYPNYPIHEQIESFRG